MSDSTIEVLHLIFASHLDECINQVCQVLPPYRSDITLMSVVIKLDPNGLHRPNRSPVKIRPDLSIAQISSEPIMVGQV